MTKIPYARRIDPATKDYVISSQSIESDDPIKAAMYLALKTEKGTSADELLGQEFTQIQVIKDDYETQVKRYVNEALKRLVNDNKIIITNIVVFKQNTKLGIQISYKDLTKNINQVIKL